jgi:hypothetical protein
VHHRLGLVDVLPVGDADLGDVVGEAADLTFSKIPELLVSLSWFTVLNEYLVSPLEGFNSIKLKGEVRQQAIFPSAPHAGARLYFSHPEKAYGRRGRVLKFGWGKGGPAFNLR